MWASVWISIPHGVPEVWIVDLEGQRLLRYLDLRKGAYTQADTPRLDRPVTTRAAELHLDLSALFAG
jgi:hypothetical protein